MADCLTHAYAHVCRSDSKTSREGLASTHADSQPEPESSVPNLSLLQMLPRKAKKAGQQRIKIELGKTEYPLLRTVAAELGWRVWHREESKEEINIFWVDSYVTDELVRRLKPYQRVNHFPSSHELGKKNCLASNLTAMRRLSQPAYDFFPATWNFPLEFADWQKYAQHHPAQFFIVKPVADSQGRGIYLTQTVEQSQECVVQEYLASPLLLEGKKFDLRIYVVVKSLQPLQVYLFQEGLARLATCDYEQPSPANLRNVKMHLTNYAINKLSPNYIFNQDDRLDHVGHKRSLSAVYQALAKVGCDVPKLQRAIEALIVKTIIAAHEKMLDSYRQLRESKDEESVCFEILGFDVIIKEDFTPILIEVNHSPSFCAETPLDLAIKKCLLLDTLALLNVSHDQKLDFLKNYKTQKDVFQLLPLQITRKTVAPPEPEQLLGGFHKIYPVAGKEDDNEELKALQKSYEQLLHMGCKKTLKKFRKLVQPVLKEPDPFQSIMAKPKSRSKAPPKDQQHLCLYGIIKKHGNATPKKEVMESVGQEEKKVKVGNKQRLVPVKNIEISFDEQNSQLATNRADIYRGQPHEMKLTLMRTAHHFHSFTERQKATNGLQTADHLRKNPDNSDELMFNPQITNTRNWHEHQYEAQLKSKIQKMQAARIKLHKHRKMECGGYIIISSKMTNLQVNS